jgi:hypothetical protein
MLAILPAAIRFGPHAVAALALLLALAWVDHRAYRSGQAACEALQADEVARQTEAAQWAARAGADAARAALAREAVIARQARDAAQAVQDDAPCLGAEAVEALRAVGR